MQPVEKGLTTFELEAQKQRNSLPTDVMEGEHDGNTYTVLQLSAACCQWALQPAPAELWKRCI